ncbi:MAG TPA: response regulator transcription factor [Candidatus Acidoferrales bacterium]|nr:response regulator transcription factor [Candidatus Acidoferrales bacterium]
MPTKPFRVLVVDDHPIVRHGVRALLERQPGIEVCCEASDGPEALEHVRRAHPDLVVLDLTLPEMNGLETTRAIREISPETEILIFAVHFSEGVAREALRSGARGYVLKSDAERELISAVERVRHHQPYFTNRLAETMAETFIYGSDDAEGSPLTPREIEVTRLLAEGKSNKEVGSVLGVSPRTAESHRNRVMRKMNFASFSELVRFAVRHNLVEP